MYNDCHFTLLCLKSEQNLKNCFDKCLENILLNKKLEIFTPFDYIKIFKGLELRNTTKSTPICQLINKSWKQFFSSIENENLIGFKKR